MKNHIFLRYPGGLKKALTFSYDDGPKSDERFIELLKKYNLKSTFHIFSRDFLGDNPKFTKESFKKIYDNLNCEVACHASHHPFLATLPSASAVLDVISDRKILEEVTEKIVKGMSYPYGNFNSEVADILSKCQINYCRTTKSTESFELPENWLVLHPTAHHSNPKIFELIDKFLNNDVRKNPEMLYIWGHTFEFARNIPFNSWEHIEKVLSSLSGKEDIWYATNGEIFDYIRDFKRLEFSAECDIVYNPTNREIWFTAEWENPWTEEFSEKVIKIAPGETLKF